MQDKGKKYQDELEVKQKNIIKSSGLVGTQVLSGGEKLELENK